MGQDKYVAALRRELAGSRAKQDAGVRAAIAAELKRCGEDVGGKPVEKAVAKRSKKSEG